MRMVHGRGCGNGTGDQGRCRPRSKRLGYAFGVALLVVAAVAAGMVQTRLNPLAARAATGAPAWQLPWPTGVSHNINGGDSYGCGGHTKYDSYAIDFNLNYETVSAAAVGTAHTVLAAASGGYGNMVWIDHGNGFVSIYAHLSRFSIGDSTLVSQGQMLGTSGNTGTSSGPHLHFAVRSGASGPFNGTAYKPEPMSGYTGFGSYGTCGVVSPMFLSQPPAGSPPARAMAITPSGQGYWTTDTNGNVYPFGDAQFKGSMGGKVLNAPIVGLAARQDGVGYWLVASDGGVFSFGVPFYGSMGGKVLNAPIVGMEVTPSGNGYWLVASDGGIFSFGDAQFKGSMGGKILNAPIVAMSGLPSGSQQGYYLLGRDGGIFAFNAPFRGSFVGMSSAPFSALTVAPGGAGYLALDTRGVSYGQGGTPPYCRTGPLPIQSQPAVAVRITPKDDGYWYLGSDGRVFPYCAFHG